MPVRQPSAPPPAGQFTQASRSSRASRNTSVSARARSTSSPFSFCRRMRLSCALSTSCAVFACRKVVPPPVAGAASPCSLSVSPTADTAASGTGFSFCAFGAFLVLDGSVASALSRSEAAASMLPSSCRTSRPAAFAFWIAPRERPTRAAYWRSLMPCIGVSDYHSKSCAYVVDKPPHQSERGPTKTMQLTKEPPR